MMTCVAFQEERFCKRRGFVREVERERCLKDMGVVGLFWLKWAGLPPAVWGSSVLGMGVETGPIGTQLGPTCA